MKRLLILIFCLLLLPALALAAGKLEIVQQNLYQFGGEPFEAFGEAIYYAKVQNTGDAPISAGTGTLKLYGENGDVLAQETYVATSPRDVILQPGEYVYVRQRLFNSILQEQRAADYEYVIEESNRPAAFERIAAETSFDFPDNGSYANYVYATFTNATDKPGYNFDITVALLDKAGNILFVEGAAMEYMAVHPGSTLTLRETVGIDFIEYYKAHGLEAATVDAIVGIAER